VAAPVSNVKSFKCAIFDEDGDLRWYAIQHHNSGVMVVVKSRMTYIIDEGPNRSLIRLTRCRFILSHAGNESATIGRLMDHKTINDSTASKLGSNSAICGSFRTRCSARPYGGTPSSLRNTRRPNLHRNGYCLASALLISINGLCPLIDFTFVPHFLLDICQRQISDWVQSIRGKV
jgi:hypothetical protein